jgi:hypothetical protein
MSEEYRLAFSGEVIEGQHAAVVKKRLAAMLKLDDERMDVLFSGRQVIVKKATDAKTAARYQEAFTKAGARLRVVPLDGADGPTPAQDPATPSSTEPSRPPSAPDTERAAADDSLSVLPAGADVLTEAERENVTGADIDTSHLSVQGATFTVAEPESEIDAPNVDHITVAEPGADLGVENEEIIVEIDADFDLAEVGATLKEADAEAEPAVDVAKIDFDVAEPGADIGTDTEGTPPPAPDTSHISLEDDDKA